MGQINNFTCKSCGATFAKADPVHGIDGLCTTCKIAFGIIRLHANPENNLDEQLRCIESLRRRHEEPDEENAGRHKNCPWCGSVGCVISKKTSSGFYMIDRGTRYRIACADLDCGASPELNWASSPEEAWKLWDNRK
jgi:ssDNA-binding Zn-finger/Zn-ribbon topoisomerase 1